MDFEMFTRLVRRGWILLVAGTMLGAGAGVMMTIATTPEYEASTEVYVSVTGATNSSELAQGATAAEQKVQSFANVARSQRVLAPVIAELGLDETPIELAKHVNAQTPIDSVIVTISVTDTSAERSARIANAIGTSLSKVITDELEQPSPDGTSPFRIETIQPAATPTSPASPRLSVNVLGGVVVGLMLGLALAALRAALDTRLDGRESVEVASGAPSIGEIAFDKSAKERPLIVQDDPSSPRAEAFRRLRTNLQFLEIGRAERSFVVTSSIPSEGKSTTAANTAIALAENGLSVALVDGDLRRPRVADLMGVEGNAGMTDVLIGRMELDDALQPWGRDGLVVLPSGQIPPNPTELLASAAMEAVVRELEQRFDIVIIDAPPLLPVTDAAVLSGITGGALLVAAVNRTTRKQLASASSALQDAGTKAIGSILTMVKAKATNAYAYNYRYESTTTTRLGPTALTAPSGRRTSLTSR
jgi:polysaccharide biosynthesis transport protein